MAASEADFVLHLRQSLAENDLSECYVDLISRVRLDLCAFKGWDEPQLVLLPGLKTYGLHGGPPGQNTQLVVPLRAEQSVPPSVLIALLDDMPDGAPQPTIAIVDNCASIIYIAISNELPPASPQQHAR
mmetsp:Transcript_15470/g.26945  ORF Transcript_15470/g.26945 Transcript_15470/m.26945 type:complete len:129 (+) Transcript_15470:161-547(+)